MEMRNCVWNWWESGQEIMFHICEIIITLLLLLLF